MPPLPAALILASGTSGRMGTPKALLPSGRGSTLLGHLANCFGAYGCSPVIAVVNDSFPGPVLPGSSVITVVNKNLEMGRAWSIRLGLRQVPRGNACFIQNVDNPFLSPELLDCLLSALSHDGYTVPTFDGRGGHPVLLGPVVVELLGGQHPWSDFRAELGKLPRFEVGFPDVRITRNINTPAEYAEMLREGLHSDKNM